MRESNFGPLPHFHSTVWPWEGKCLINMTRTSKIMSIWRWSHLSVIKLNLTAHAIQVQFFQNLVTWCWKKHLQNHFSAFDCSYCFIHVFFFLVGCMPIMKHAICSVYTYHFVSKLTHSKITLYKPSPAAVFSNNWFSCFLKWVENNQNTADLT